MRKDEKKQPEWLVSVTSIDGLTYYGEGDTEEEARALALARLKAAEEQQENELIQNSI